ncbi:hypothetical protein EDD69_10354 [Thermolongibacillus altinsuensis]|jgi:hypothetical protein|uniref:Uncharacterized protein n=1 Tax=Thermolongibacillus altinsuensis TaxID=575256 RepID=A0A4V2QAG9_9BACL|nr:hypothetical protein [Thermolongibacillus altinsuensis]TCL51815.1 hypothetical protein EDD69_10354 [Thermolongibacillus altinsuensis]GMB07342.1 hypothetical protein B1no1_00520 [Thermolongibacillus altinsuensis]
MREKEEKEILYYDEEGVAEINEQITNAYASGVIEQRTDDGEEKRR